MAVVLSCLSPPSPDALSKCLNQCLSFHALSPWVFVYTVLSVHVGSVMHLFAYDCYFWGRPLRLGSLLGVQNEKCCLYNLCVIVSSSPVCQSLVTLGLKQAVLRMAFLFKCCLSSFNTQIQQTVVLVNVKSMNKPVFWKFCCLWVWDWVPDV